MILLAGTFTECTFLHYILLNWLVNRLSCWLQAGTAYYKVLNSYTVLSEFFVAPTFHKKLQTRIFMFNFSQIS